LYPRLEPCTYCGLPAATRDHVLPQVLASSLQLAGLENAPDRTTVPACHECNSILGSRVFPSLAARRNAVHASLAKRYHSILHAPRWAPEDIAALGPTLRSAVERQQYIREVTLDRLCWPGKRVARPVVVKENANGCGPPPERSTPGQRVAPSRKHRRRSEPTGEPIPCPSCGVRFRPRRRWARYCSGRCRMAAWDKAHPRSGHP